MPLAPEATRVDVRLRRAIESGRMPAELLVCGPAGTGKTFGILCVLHLLLADYPGLRVLIVRKTRSSLSETALVTYEQAVLPLDGAGSIAEGVQRRVRQSYRYPNGSEMVVAGLDNPEKIKSSDWDVIYPNEATELDENDWEFLASRLDRPGRKTRLGFLVADCNPDGPHHWLKKRCEKGKTALWTTLHEANPVMHDGRGWTDAGLRYKEKRLDTLTGVRRLRLRDGVWAGAEGLIYPDWDDAVHHVHWADLYPTLPAVPADWPRFWAIDFGHTNPFAWQEWATDPDGRAIRLREIYRTKTLVEDHAARVLELTAGSPRPRAVICDHDAEGRATFERHAGFATIPAYKGVTDGIEAVASRLRRAGDGRPRLFVLRDGLDGRDPDLDDRNLPACVAEEFGLYAWDTRQGRRKGDEPVKLHDHGLDALRYFVAFLDLDPAAQPGHFATVERPAAPTRAAESFTPGLDRYFDGGW